MDPRTSAAAQNWALLTFYPKQSTWLSTQWAVSMQCCMLFPNMLVRFPFITKPVLIYSFTNKQIYCDHYMTQLINDALVSASTVLCCIRCRIHNHAAALFFIRATKCGKWPWKVSKATTDKAMESTQCGPRHYDAVKRPCRWTQQSQSCPFCQW